jgi:hypothetical protein
MSVDYATAVVPPSQLQMLLQSGATGDALGRVGRPTRFAGWKAGARPGNLLTHVNGQRVTTPSQFHEIAEPLEGDVKIRLFAGEVTVC